MEHLGTKPGEFPVTERSAASLVRLPLFPHMTEAETAYVIDATSKFFLGGNVIQAPVYHAQARTEAEEETLDFSLVLPCFQEEGHIKNSLDEILRTLDRLQISYEIILIDDCSRDSTTEKIREYQMSHPEHRIRSAFHKKNCGRGATVMEGMRMAKGRYVGFLDIDLEVHAHYIPAALLKLQSGVADVVIADRSYQNPILFLHRTLMSYGYRWLVRSILHIPVMDTESGFKFFVRREILPILGKCQDMRWFWDTEITVRSYDAGLRILSLPVLFTKRQEKKTTVKFFHDSWRSLSALIQFKKLREVKQ
jgi:glycosyltransferase involved in cell wall biosynthesis